MNGFLENNRIFMPDIDVTIIIPVYNAEKYIRRCLDSIAKQDFSDYELVVIDDGSTDMSYEICKNYNLIIKNMIIKRIDNHGQGYARNVGIDLARGKYILFIDADDSIESNYISTLFDEITKNNTDISICAATFVPGPLLAHKEEICSSKELIKDVLYKNGVADYPWGKIYKKELFNNNRFLEGVPSEDFELFYRLYSNANVISYSNNTTYYYYQNIGSDSISLFNEKYLYRIKICENLINSIKDKDLFDALYARIVDEALFIYSILPLREYGDTSKWINKTIRNHYKSVLKDNNVRKKEKKKLTLFLICPLILKLRPYAKYAYIKIFK